MSFVIIGTNHKYSPLSFRERVTVAASKLPAVLALLKEKKELTGGVMLSTCNRLEIYASGNSAQGASKKGHREAQPV